MSGCKRAPLKKSTPMLFRQAPVIVLPARDLSLSVHLVAAECTDDPVCKFQIKSVQLRSSALSYSNRPLEPEHNRPLESFPLFPLFLFFLRLLAALLRLFHRRRQQSCRYKLDPKARRPVTRASGWTSPDDPTSLTRLQIKRSVNRRQLL